MSTRISDLKMGETRVSSLEQASPVVHVRTLCCFKLQVDFQIAGITRILKEALAATFTELPVLKGQVLPLDDGEQQGKQDLEPGGSDDLYVEDLTSMSLEYDDLRVKEFPLSTFDDEVFWATPAFPTPGDMVAVFTVQANFIKGGLLLGISFWHQVMDGVALATALRVLAQNCLRIQDPSLDGEIVESLPETIFDKSRLNESPPQYKGLIADHTEYVLADDLPTGPPSYLNARVEVEVFHISPESIKALKLAATPVIEHEAHQNEPIWVSTNDAISALIWRSIMVATYKGTEYDDKSRSCCQVAVNGRPKMDPPLPADHLGCVLILATNDLPISSILTVDSLPVMALMVRQSIMKITAYYIRSLIAMMRKVPDFRRLTPRSFEDLLGHDMILTSWATFPLYDYDWGPALGGKCERVRGPKLGMFNGVQVVLPALPDRLGGGHELMIGLEPDVMQKLKADEVWSIFCSST